MKKRKAATRRERQAITDMILVASRYDGGEARELGDNPVNGADHIISRGKGKRSKQGRALIWEDHQEGEQPRGVLTRSLMDRVLNEAKEMGIALPVRIYATGSVAPIAGDLYTFHQLNHLALKGLGVVPLKDQEDEPEEEMVHAIPVHPEMMDQAGRHMALTYCGIPELGVRVDNGMNDEKILSAPKPCSTCMEGIGREMNSEQSMTLIR